jgi:hypothetical protein
MNNPNEIVELVTLDRVLEENGLGVEVFEASKLSDRYAIKYSYPAFSGFNQLGKTFGEVAEKLVPASGGKITMRPKSGGFVALFPTEEKRLDFLKAFSKAVSKSDYKKIITTQTGFRLGA